VVVHLTYLFAFIAFFAFFRFGFDFHGHWHVQQTGTPHSFRLGQDLVGLQHDRPQLHHLNK
jgi:hypothetical protein